MVPDIVHKFQIRGLKLVLYKVFFICYLEFQDGLHCHKISKIFSFICILVLGVCQRSRPGDCFSRDVLFYLTLPLFFSDVGGLKRVSRVELLC
jgi:hypothetical protein